PGRRVDRDHVEGGVVLDFEGDGDRPADGPLGLIAVVLVDPGG
ncbi:MAG: hypothetical protein ACI9CA_001221, partial [Natronomonas sp.]